MLKIMRSHKFFTVFLLSVVTGMIIVSFIFWGIGPKDNPTIQFVAEIEDWKISLDDYWRAYDNEYNRVRDTVSSEEELQSLNLQGRVLDSLVDRTVLLVAARKAGITVSEEELQEAIMSTPFFQRDGVFNREVYLRALRLNRTSPQSFEAGLTKDLIVTKMSRLIGETAELTPEETKILDSLQEGNREQLAQVFRSSRTSQAVKAYIEGMKRQLKITINRELIF